jgi:hypothetical protein
MRQNRGNVLITALFMAIFLFFLSVALISQNRMDISLGLSVDHRLKADSAARAGLNWALRTMRNEPNWLERLQTAPPQLESGARIEVKVRSRSDPSGDPNLLLLSSTGTSGIVSAHHWAIVEEVEKTPQGSARSAQLFTLAWNEEAKPPVADRLAMLGSDFQWYDLGQLPTPDATLEASGGPLFLFGPEGSAQPPPSLVDALPLFLPETGEQTLGPRVRMELVPPGRHLLTLQINDGQGEWVDIPDPGPQLGSWAGLTEITSDALRALPVLRIWEDPDQLPDDRPPWDRRNVFLTGRGDRTSGFEVFTFNSDLGIWNEETGQYESITTSKPWTEVVSHSLEELTLDWETITDTPLIYLEWYSLTGQALAARGQKIACQGEHFFYGHIPVPNETWPDLGTPVYDSIVYRRPCVLEYDMEKGEWSRPVDLMEVTQKTSPPRLTTSPPWLDSFLEIDSKDQVWLTARQRSQVTLLRFDDDTRYQSMGQVPGDQPRVIVYQDQPYYFSEREQWSSTEARPRRTLMGFNGQSLDPQSQLGATLPGVSAFIQEGGAVTEMQLKPREQISVGLAGVAYDLTTWGSDLIATGLIRRDIEDLEMPQRGDYNGRPVENPMLTEPKRLVSFLRYDGVSWQVLPGGTDDLLKAINYRSSGEKIEVPTLSGKPLLLYPHQLALASYQDGYPDLRRYSVLAAGKDKAPRLRGFSD